eukprot:Pgem_evm1s13097
MYTKLQSESDLEEIEINDIDLQDIIRENETVLYIARPRDLTSIKKNASLVVCIPPFIPCCLLSPFCYPFLVNQALNQALIVTNRTVYFYQGDTTLCNCCSTGFVVKGLSLDKIQNIDVFEPGVGCGQTWFNIPRMVIETAGQAGPNAQPEIQIKGIFDVTK